MIPINFRIERDSGASLVEFVVAAPFLLLLGLGTVQMGLIYHAKTTLNYATFEAARTGAVNHAQISHMEEELAYRLAPVYGGSGSESSAGGAIAAAFADSISPFAAKVEILNPTAAMFDAWEVRDQYSDEMQIPNHHMRHQSQESRAGVTLHDANLLKIRTEYGYEMKIPLAGKLIAETMAQLYPENSRFYLAGRIPLTSVATVRMQNEARRSNPSTPLIAVAETNNSVTTESSFSGDSSVAAGPVAECDENGLGPTISDNFSQLNVDLTPDNISELEECVSPAGIAGGNSLIQQTTGNQLLGGGLNGSSPALGGCV